MNKSGLPSGSHLAPIALLVHKVVWVGLILALLGTVTYAQESSEIVRWNASLNSARLLKPGEKITSQLRAKIRPGWHVYSISQLPGGPRPTTIEIPEGQVLTQDGTILGPVPRSAYDPNFDIKVEFYKDMAVFRVPLTVAPYAKPGTGKIVIAVRFQTCNDRICLPPTTVEVPLPFRVARSNPQ